MVYKKWSKYLSAAEAYGARKGAADTRLGTQTQAISLRAFPILQNASTGFVVDAEAWENLCLKYDSDLVTHVL